MFLLYDNNLLMNIEKKIIVIKRLTHITFGLFTIVFYLEK